jgi:hypothetical protein
MSETELTRLRQLITSLTDIADSAESGTRHRDYVLSDLREDIHDLMRLVRTMEAPYAQAQD